MVVYGVHIRLWPTLVVMTKVYTRKVTTRLGVGLWGLMQLEKHQQNQKSVLEIPRDGSYGVGVLYVVSYLSRIYPYFSKCSV